MIVTGFGPAIALVGGLLALAGMWAYAIGYAVRQSRRESRGEA